MFKRIVLVAVLVSLTAPLFMGCDKDGSGSASAPDTGSVIEIVKNDPDYSTLWSLVSAAGMGDALDPKRDDVTLLGPNNAAFAALGQATLDELMLPENQAQLQAILANHVLAGAVSAPKIAGGEYGATAGGQQLRAGRDDTGAATLDGVRVIRSIRADNGYVHVIDEVILTPPAADEPAQ
ncbi:MAG: fasciclin domain-containing protein [Myxococcota bacterium]